MWTDTRIHFSCTLLLGEVQNDAASCNFSFFPMKSRSAFGENYLMLKPYLDSGCKGNRMFSSLSGEEWDFQFLSTQAALCMILVGCAFHLHTSSTCVAAVVLALCRLPGLRAFCLQHSARFQIFVPPAVIFFFNQGLKPSIHRDVLYHTDPVH